MPLTAPANASEMITYAFHTPMDFVTGIYYDPTLGTLNTAGVLLGYEE